MPRCCFGYVSYESMRDYAGFSYASLLDLVMFRWIWLCFVVFVVSVMFL